MSKRRSDSLWYPRYVGDYQRKTAHLSLAEHGVYALLLDHYYSTGKPLPANASRLQTICRAFADQDVAAMHAVVQEFFVLDGDVYRNYRADEELLKRCDISEKRREAAQARHANAPANGGANAPAIADTSTTTTTTTSIRTRKARAAPDATPEVAADFAIWWDKSNRAGSKQSALREYALRRKEGVSKDELELGASRWASAMSREVGDYRPLASIHAVNWLKRRRWLDDDHTNPVRARPSEPQRLQMDEAMALIEKQGLERR